MTTPFKWLFSFILLLVVIFVVVYNSSVQNTAFRTTAEVEVLAETISLGLIRSEVSEGSEGYAYFDKEELVANLIANVSEVQKDHPYDIELTYAFTDKDGGFTEDEKLMRGIQFVVQYKNDKGEVKATAERRLSLNTLHLDLAIEDDPTNPVESYKTIKLSSLENKDINKTQTFRIAGFKNIKSITSNTGTAEFVRVIGDDVTISMKNGVPKKSLVSGELIPVSKKFVTAQTARNFNQDGYSGSLKQYVYSGELLEKKVVDLLITLPEDKTFNTLNSVYINDDGTWIKSGAGSYSKIYVDDDYEYTSESSGYEAVNFESFVTMQNLKANLIVDVIKENNFAGCVRETSSSRYNCVFNNIKKTETYLDEYIPGISLTLRGGSYLYTGTLRKDTRTYRYEGEVTKPSSDTRVYEDLYKYDLTIEYLSN